MSLKMQNHTNVMKSRKQTCGQTTRKLLLLAVLSLMVALTAACSSATPAEENILPPDVLEYAEQCFSGKTAADGAEVPAHENMNVYVQEQNPDRFACEYFYKTEENGRQRYICVLERQNGGIVLLKESEDPQEDINFLLNQK